MMSKVIKTNGEVYDCLPTDGKAFTLEEMQGIVGGYIQIITLDEYLVMVLNEDGKYNCKMNQDATEVAQWYDAIHPMDYISGDVLVTQSKFIG